jgi:hypothetical protein
MSRVLTSRKPKRVRVVANDIEDVIQAQIVSLLENHAIPLLIWFAIPNGGKRDIRTAVKMKATGTKAGVLDLQLICPRTLKPHFMEVKEPINGHLSKEQEKFGEQCTLLGIPWAVVTSLEEAEKQLDEWQFLT